MKKLQLFLTTLALLAGSQSRGEDVLKFEVDGFHFSSDWDVDPALGEIMVENPDKTLSGGESTYQFPLENGSLVLPSVVDYEGVAYTVVKVSGIVRQTELISVVVPSTVRVVDGICVCPKLEKIDLGEALSIGDVRDLPVLKEVVFPSDVVINVSMSDLVNVGIKEFQAPRLVLDRFSFCHWPLLEDLDLSAMDGIGTEVLNDFPRITRLVMPTTLGESEVKCVAFDSMNGLPELKSLTMPEYVQEGCYIAECLTDCGNLEVIYCPSSVPIDIKVLTNRDELIWPAAGAPASSRDAFHSRTSSEDNGGPVAIYEYTNIGREKVDTENCMVYVPQGCVEAYRSHPSWGVFKNIMEYDFASNAVIKTGMDDVAVSVEGDAIRVLPDCGFEVYDIAGKRCATSGLSSGIYVVKTSLGTVAKVVVH